MKLRVKFSKHGVLKFIGHLDVMRYFQKAIRRAELDIAYSGGFSPHQVMSFAAPLGVGLESNGEYMDIEVNSVTTQAEILEALNRQMAEGIKVLEVKLLPELTENAMASVAAAAYSIRFREGYEPSFDYRKAIQELCAQEEIIITKKTKRGESTFDMKPFLFDCQISEDGTIHLTVDASSAGNIKPTLVLTAVYASVGATLDDMALMITREETYTKVEEEGVSRLVPLGEMGKDF